MAGLMEGKKGIVFGVANKRSIAWAICQSLAGAGAQLTITYQNERLEENAKDLSKDLKDSVILRCDVQNEAEVKSVFGQIESKWGSLDFLVHSLAFAKAEELEGEYIKASKEGFLLALEVSAYSLTLLAREARGLLSKSGGSIVAMTYIGGERAVPGYNTMGVAKAALESSIQYLANDLGPQNIRVNAISAGPINTLAARGIKGFGEILKHVSAKSPMKRNIEAAEVGDTALFLCSNLSRGITGEVIHVDAGYHCMGL